MTMQISPYKLMGVFTEFAFENDIPYRRLSDNQIVLGVESDFNSLHTVFQLQANQDGYEHYTHVLTVPYAKRGEIAGAAISEAFRGISPVLPNGDNRLFVYGSRSGLLDKSKEEIREGILDDMGRVAGYDNIKYPIFSRILLKK